MVKKQLQLSIAPHSKSYNHQSFASFETILHFLGIIMIYYYALANGD
jgi:hypothetical protein